MSSLLTLRAASRSGICRQLARSRRISSDSTATSTCSNGTRRRCTKAAGASQQFIKSRNPFSTLSCLDPSAMTRAATMDHDLYRKLRELQRNEQECRMLATSSSMTKKEKQYLRRLVKWVKNWLYSIWESFLVSLRCSEILLRLSPLVILTPAAVLTAQFTDPLGRNAVSDWAWWYTMAQVQQLGPGYTKLCQWIATRRDLFPVHICVRLSQLHDQAYPHSIRDTKRILNEAFGDYEDKGLQLFEVIGCGSAAQVYKGSLKKDGTARPVAVKVLHPGYQKQIENDLWFIDTIARHVHALPSETIKMVNLPRAVSNFGANLRRQADLRIEGDNLRQFRANFYGSKDAEDPQSAILFPRPVDGWVSSKVLVEDLVQEATPIAEFLDDVSEVGLETRKQIAGPLLRAFLKMVFQDNFVHCDLHPGNVMIQTIKLDDEHAKAVSSKNPLARWYTKHNTTISETADGEKVKRTIVFLDAGIATSLSANDRKNLRDLFRAVVFNDGFTAGKLMVERARYERCSQTEGGVEAFANGVGDIVAEFHDNRKQGLTLGAVRIGSLLSRVLDLCREHGVEIDPSMASIVISTLVLEGLGRSLEPSLNLMDCAIPFVLGRGKV